MQPVIFLRGKTAFLYILMGALLLGSCQYLKKEPALKKAANAEEGYYSIKGFLDDQWNLLEGQPYVLLRVAQFNGVSDSSFVPLDSALWKDIRKQFDPSDISDQRFLNQYTYTSFSDNTLNLIYLNYEARNETLFTQKLTIGVDNVNHKIRSVFIETRAHNKTYERTQKLTYLPRDLIRIQAFEKSVISKAEQLTVSYYFNF